MKVNYFTCLLACTYCLFCRYPASHRPVCPRGTANHKSPDNKQYNQPTRATHSQQINTIAMLYFLKILDDCDKCLSRFFTKKIVLSEFGRPNHLKCHTLSSVHVWQLIYFVENTEGRFMVLYLSTVTGCHHKHQAENSLVSLNHFLWCSLMFSFSLLVACFHTKCCARLDTMESVWFAEAMWTHCQQCCV